MGLTRIREPITREEGQFRVLSLFPWRRNGPRAFSWLVQSLKRHDEIEPWLEISANLLNAFGPIESAIFVPVPSTHKRNHALGFAKALSHWSGMPVVEALGAIEKKQQKRMGRGERADIRFERAIWDFCTEYTNVIVVDDVVTTGATARAAYHTLGRPQHFEVWCLLDRVSTTPARGLLSQISN